MLPGMPLEAVAAVSQSVSQLTGFQLKALDLHCTFSLQTSAMSCRPVGMGGAAWGKSKPISPWSWKMDWGGQGWSQPIAVEWQQQVINAVAKALLANSQSDHGCNPKRCQSQTECKPPRHSRADMAKA